MVYKKDNIYYRYSQGRLSLSINGATEPWPFFWGGDIFSVKKLILKIDDLQTLCSALFQRMFRHDM